MTLEEEYFEKFKRLGMYLAYGDMVDTINVVKEKYRSEAGIKRNWAETAQIIRALDFVSNIAQGKAQEEIHNV